jgi:hypothetical protein
MNGDDVERFLAQFFSMPNRLSLEALEQNTRLRVFAEYVRELRSRQAKWVVLPCWREKYAVDYYALSFNDRDFRQLGKDLEAFVGCSYSIFELRRADLTADDPIENAIRQLGVGFVYKFKSDPKDENGSPQISQKLALMRELSVQRQVRRPRQRLPLHMVLRDYYMALEAQNRPSAEKAIEEIRTDGLLDAVNVLFLKTLVICRFGSLLELEQSGIQVDLLTLRRPLAVTEALISLIYGAELSSFEERRDVSGAVDRLKRRLLPLYGDLYRSWHGMRSAEAAKSFMLVAIASSPPDSTLRNAILERKTDFLFDDTNWLEALATEFPSVPETTSRTEIIVGVDAALQSALNSPVSLENVRTLCRSAAFDDTLEVRQVIRDRYLQLSPKQQRELRATKVSAALLDELLEASVHDDVQSVPQSWGEWLETLKITNPWGKAVETARKGSTEWKLTDRNADPEVLTTLLLDVQERMELRVALPHLIACARADVLWPRSEWRGFYEAMMDVLTSYTEGSVSDLTVWGELADVLLGLGLSKQRYLGICADAGDLWKAHASAATLDWATELLDTLLFYPCPDEPARVDLFVAVAAKAHGFSRLLEPGQCAFLQVLASDYGQNEWQSAFQSEKTQANEQLGASVFANLSGMIVAIYSLTERVSKRVKTILETLCPDADVRISADLVGTPMLRTLARDADIFVVNTASAKHAATQFISANRKSSSPTLFHNARGSQSMISLIEHYLISRVT